MDKDISNGSNRMWEEEEEEVLPSSNGYISRINWPVRDGSDGDDNGDDDSGGDNGNDDGDDGGGSMHYMKWLTH